MTYTYDGFGQRRTKTAGGSKTDYVYENGKLLRESGPNGTIDYLYGEDGIIGIKIGSAKYLFRKNVFGDVTEIYNEAGTLVGKYSYTVFGECRVETNEGGIAEKNPIRYRGYYYDEETDFYYLKTRYYDPEIGRFITIDDVTYLASDTINGLNLYAYCGNNPVMYIDPEGTWSWKGFWNVLGAIGVIIAVTAGVVLTAGAFAFVAGGFAVAAGITTAATAATIVQGVVFGAAIGGLVAGGLELTGQLLTVGAENLDITAIAIESFSGGGCTEQ